MNIQKPDINKPVFKVFTNTKELVENKKCVICRKDIVEDDFRDELSIKEYSISGMCQKCQDKVFGV